MDPSRQLSMSSSSSIGFLDGSRIAALNGHESQASEDMFICCRHFQGPAAKFHLGDEPELVIPCAFLCSAWEKRSGILSGGDIFISG